MLNHDTVRVGTRQEIEELKWENVELKEPAADTLRARSWNALERPSGR